ncbi:hypothetical protein D9M72_372140 [compost metagenome]
MLAISAGSARRRSQHDDFMPSSTFSGTVCRISVLTKPGHTAFTRTPLGPSSRAQVLVKPITPNLLAA